MQPEGPVWDPQLEPPCTVGDPPLPAEITGTGIGTIAPAGTVPVTGSPIAAAENAAKFNFAA